MAYQPKSYKKFVATAATATLVASALVPTASAATFTDVNKNYTEAVNYLVANKIAQGTSETTFGTDASITRGDAAVMIANALKLDTSKAPASSFTDLNTRVKDAVNALYAAGIINGKSTTQFAPADKITRAEMAKVIALAYKLDRTGTTNEFTDVNSTFDQYVDSLVKHEITLGKTPSLFGATQNVTRGEFALFVYRAETLVPATPEVVSVSAINGTTVQVVFGQPVNASTLYDANGLINASALTFSPTTSAAPITASNLKGSLSADGKVLTVNVTGGTEYFNGTYAIEVLEDVVKLKNDASAFIDSYKGLITVSDKVGASITGVTYDGSSAVVKFSEALSTEGTISLNGNVLVEGTDYNAFTAGGSSITLNNLTAGKSYSLSVVGAKDVAGNFTSPNALSYTINAPVDNAKPTVAVSVTGTKVTFDFSEDLKLVDADGNLAVSEYAKVTLGTGTTVNLTATEQNAADKSKFVYDFNTDVTGSFLNTTVKVEGFVDKSGLSGDAVTTAVSLQKDATAPKFVSASTKGDSLIVKFDEDVADAGITAADLSIKYVDNDGVLTPAAAPSTIGAVASSYDANGNGVIDGDEENYVTISLAGSQFATVAGKLNAGTYTVSIAAGEVVDTAAIPNPTTVATTFNVAVAADSATKAIVELLSSVQQATPGQILVTYNYDLSASGLVASNYKLGGVTLPSNTTLTFLNNKRNVLITLPEGYIAATGDRVLEVSNLTDVNGNTLKAGSTSFVTSTVKENVVPLANKLTVVSDAQAVVDFTEVVTGATTGIKVKVNNVEVTPASLVVTAGDLVVNFAAGTVKAGDKVIVEFSGAALADAAGNTVKNGSISN